MGDGGVGGGHEEQNMNTVDKEVLEVVLRQSLKVLGANEGLMASC